MSKYIIELFFSKKKTHMEALGHGKLNRKLKHF
jgi:hypothetical protein